MATESQHEPPEYLTVQQAIDLLDSRLRVGQQCQELVMRVIGQVVHTRNLSRRLCFYDIVNPRVGWTLSHDEHVLSAHSTGTCERQSLLAESRIEVITKCPDISVEQVQAIRHQISNGDDVCFEGWFERNNDNGSLLLHAVNVHVLQRWRDHSHISFVPQPISVHRKAATTTTSTSTATSTCATTSPTTTTTTTTATAPTTTPTATTPTTTAPEETWCKFWINTGQCTRIGCQYLHGRHIDKGQRQEWVSERHRHRRQVFLESMQQQAATLHIASASAIATQQPQQHNDHQQHDQHQQVQSRRLRAALFADFLVTTFGRDFLASGSGVLDVAGGRGELAFELHCRLNVPCTLIEPRPMKLDKRQAAFLRKHPTVRPPPQIQQLFGPSLLEPDTDRRGGGGGGGGGSDDGDTGSDRQHQCYRELLYNASMVVAMHPDQATEPAVDFAIQCAKPWAVVPCCVFSHMFPNRRLQDGKCVTSYDDFVRFLQEKDRARSRLAYLAFQGKNCVVFVGPQLASTTATATT
jgi:hypothetical protein